MDITKRAKRWMATVMTTALALTSLVVAPKPASAATDVPTVEVKGATLRLAGTQDGKQAMRIGVVISKADLATACGIQIGYKGKTTTIATDKGYNKIYDYDETKQEVVYTAVIKDIPSTAFADDFTITGLVKGTDDEEYKTSSSSVEKSINGIVESLGSDYKLAGGILVKKAGEMDINNVNDGQYAWEQAVIDNGCTSEVVTYNDQTCLKVSKGTKAAASVKFKFSGEPSNSAGRKFWLEVDACSDSGYIITSYSPDKKQEETTDFVKTDYFITGNGTYGYEQFTVKPNKDGDDLYVKSFAVYEAVSSLGYDAMEIDRGFVTLSAENETINDPSNQISYADGKANVEKLFRRYGGLGVAYNFKPNGKKIDLSQYSKIILTITSEKEYPLCIQLVNDISGDGYWNRTGSMKKGKVEYFSTTAGTKTYTYNISDIKGNLTEAEAIFIKNNPPQLPDGITDDNVTDETEIRSDAIFTINSIQLI